MRSRFAIPGDDGGEYAKLVLISEKATELHEQRKEKEEEGSSPPPQHHADRVRRRVGMGSCKLKRRRGRGRGGTRCTGPMKIFWVKEPHFQRKQIK